MNLRELYKERGIQTVNATLLEKRESSIKEILEEEQLEYDEWELLTNWIMGINEAEQKTEQILIKVEEAFCRQDELFSKENEKEMQVLLSELIYRYCRNKKEKKFPLMILCGYGMGHKLKSEKAYKEFVHLLDGWRLDMRRDESKEEEINFPDMEIFRESIEDKQKEAGNKRTVWAADQDDWNGVLDILESCEEAIGILVKKNEQCQKQLYVQREESDILWWMLNEWSDIYKRPFNTLKREQLTLAAPIELQNMIFDQLGPLAVKQVLYKVLSLAQTEHRNLTMSQLISTADENILVQLNFDKSKGSGVQPMLLAMKCKAEAGEESWKDLFTRTCGINPDEIKKNLEEFSYQLYLELELAGLALN